MCIPFYIGDDCFEFVFFFSGQLLESLLIGANFPQKYGCVVNFKTNCQMYGTEGNVKECKFKNNVQAQLEPQESIGHGLSETADCDVMQTLNEETVWTIGKYIRYDNRNQEFIR